MTLTRHPLWTYLLRRLLVGGLFVLLGFALFNLSLLADPGGFLALGSPLLVFCLAAIALSVIAHLVGRWLNPSVVDTPPCQAIASAAEAYNLLFNLTAANEIALLEPISHAQALLSQKWSASIERPRDLVGKLTLDSRINARWLAEVAAKITRKKKLEESDRKRLQKLFGWLSQKVVVNPNYRPEFSSALLTGLLVVPVLLLMACVTLLFFIFTGGIGIGGMAWSMSLAAGCGFFAWTIASYILDKMSGSANEVWTTLWAMTVVTCLLLGSLGLATGAFAASAALPLFAVAIVLMVAAPLLRVIWDRVFSEQLKPAESATPSQSRFSHYAWLGLKIVLMMGFLLLAFLSIAMLFNLQKLGPFSGLMDYAFEVAVQALKMDGYTVGADWISAFSIAIFSTASFIAFELFKSILTRYPATAKELQRYQEGIAVAVLGFKLIFTAGIIIALMAMPSAFALAGSISLLPVFLIIAGVLPLFSGNLNLPYFKKTNEVFNRWFGVAFFEQGKWWNYPVRELLVTLVALAPLAFFININNLQPFAVGLIGIGIMLLARWVKMYANWADPRVHAQTQLQQQEKALRQDVKEFLNALASRASFNLAIGQDFQEIKQLVVLLNRIKQLPGYDFQAEQRALREYMEQALKALQKDINGVQLDTEIISFKDMLTAVELYHRGEQLAEYDYRSNQEDQFKHECLKLKVQQTYQSYGLYKWLVLKKFVSLLEENNPAILLEALKLRFGPNQSISGPTDQQVKAYIQAALAEQARVSEYGLRPAQNIVLDAYFHYAENYITSPAKIAAAGRGTDSPLQEHMDEARSVASTDNDSSGSPTPDSSDQGSARASPDVVSVGVTVSANEERQLRRFKDFQKAVAADEVFVLLEEIPPDENGYIDLSKIGGRLSAHLENIEEAVEAGRKLPKPEAKEASSISALDDSGDDDTYGPLYAADHRKNLQNEYARSLKKIKELQAALALDQLEKTPERTATNLQQLIAWLERLIASKQGLAELKEEPEELKRSSAGVSATVPGVPADSATVLAFLPPLLQAVCSLYFAQNTPFAGDTRKDVGAAIKKLLHLGSALQGETLRQQLEGQFPLLTAADFLSDDEEEEVYSPTDDLQAMPSRKEQGSTNSGAIIVQLGGRGSSLPQAAHAAQAAAPPIERKRVSSPVSKVGAGLKSTSAADDLPGMMSAQTVVSKIAGLGGASE